MEQPKADETAASAAAEAAAGGIDAVVPAAPGTPVAAVEAEPPVVLDYRSPLTPPDGISHVGTLKYTRTALIALFFWLLLGDFAVSIRDRSVGPVVQLMLKSIGASDTAMAVLLSVIPQAITMILAPIVSYKSDRFRSRWGRRIPFLLIPTPIAAVAMIGLAFCPRLAHGLDHLLGGYSPGYKGCVLTLFAICWTGFEFAVVTATAVLGGLVNDVVPRNVLGRFYALFRGQPDRRDDLQLLHHRPRREAL